jgi:2'-5' RNA ligase
MKLSSKGHHRLFFAIDFDESFKQSLYDWICSLDINGRLVAMENLHLTLQFLGQINNHQVFDIVDRISIPQIKPFEIRLDKTGYFPKNQILFCEVASDTSPIKKLSQSIQNQLKEVTFIKREKRRFHPHITIAREAIPPVDFVMNNSLIAQVKYFCLMESITIKSGVHYEVVESWPLYRPSDKEILLGYRE